MGSRQKLKRHKDLWQRFSGGERLTLRQISSFYAISPRTAQRDLLELQSSGLGLEAHKTAEGIEEWSAAECRASVLELTRQPGNLATIALGQRLDELLRGTQFQESVSKVYSKMEDAVGDVPCLDAASKLASKLYLAHEPPRSLNQRNLATLEICLDGLIKEYEVEIYYIEVAQGGQRRSIRPYSLVAYRRGLYLIGHSNEDEAVRTFTVERIAAAHADRGRSFVYPLGFDPEKHFDRGMFMVTGSPVKVELRFNESTEPLLTLRRLSFSGRLEREQDGSLLMRLEAPVDYEIVHWVLSFGSQVEVLSPESLRVWVREELDKALANYTL